MRACDEIPGQRCTDFRELSNNKGPRKENVNGQIMSVWKCGHCFNTIYLKDSTEMWISRNGGRRRLTRRGPT